MFSNLDSSIQFEVKLGSSIKVCVKGKGVIVVYTRNGDRRTINYVYYVPSLKCNLLDIGQLIEKRYRVFFKNNVCTIIDKYPSKMLIARVEMTKNRMFPLIMRNELSPSLNGYKTNKLDESWLWHLRYGHLYFGGLDLLQKKQMVKELPSIQRPMSSCKSCILAKHNRHKFVSQVSYRVGPKLHWRLFTHIYVDQCKHFLWLVMFIF